MPAPPSWLRRWRQLLVHLVNLVVTVSKSVLHYADWTEEIEEQREDFENDQENYPDMGLEQMSLDSSAL